MQSKKLSIIEALTNTVVGLIISFLIQIVIYKALKIDVTIKQNLIITIIFFIASIIRGYAIRRIFTKLKKHE
jgi:flagellar motor component MotA